MSDACLECGHAGPLSWYGWRFEGTWGARGSAWRLPGLRAGNASAVLRQASNRAVWKRWRPGASFNGRRTLRRRDETSIFGKFN